MWGPKGLHFNIFENWKDTFAPDNLMGSRDSLMGITWQLNGQMWQLDGHGFKLIAQTLKLGKNLTT